MRRGAMRPPWSHFEPSCDVCAAPARSRSSAARFCSLLLPAADALRLPSPCREPLNPPRGRGASVALESLGSFLLPFFLLAIGNEFGKRWGVGVRRDSVWVVRSVAPDSPLLTDVGV